MKLNLVLKWAVGASLLTTLYYVIQFLHLGYLPSPATEIDTEFFSYTTPLSVSHWWDIAFIFFYVIVASRILKKIKACSPTNSFELSGDDKDSDISDAIITSFLCSLLGGILTAMFLSDSLLLPFIMLVFAWPVTYFVASRGTSILREPKKCVYICCATLAMSSTLILTIKYGGLTASILGIIIYLIASSWTWLGLTMAQGYIRKKASLQLVQKEAS